MTLHKMFTDNMVLQANKPVRVFGQGRGVAKVRFCGKTYIVCTQGDTWEITLPAMPYGGPYDMEITLNGMTRTLKNVMLGEVILCAGQSNMQFAVKEEIVDSGYVYEIYPAMRIFVQERIENYEGIKSDDGWLVCETETIGEWSAIGYHVARILHERKGVAVGIIGCYQGSSIIESWIKESIICAPEFFVPKEKRRFNERHPMYARNVKWNVYGKLYQEVFSKILPYSVGSIVWYQGESNTSVAEGKMYDVWLKLLADSWRADLRDPAIPFVIMQIADFDYIKEGWSEIQAAQERASSIIENARFVETKDVCESDNIHPIDKRTISERVYKVLFEGEER